MLSLEQCKKLLINNGKIYSDEQIKQLRLILYQLGELDYKLFNESKNEKCNNIYQNFGGRPVPI